MYKDIPGIHDGAAILPLLMHQRNGPERTRNRSEPPPSPGQDRESPDREETPIPRTSGNSRSLTVVEASQARRKGHAIRRLVTLCGTITQLVAENDRRLLAPEPDTSSNEDGDIDEDNEDHSPERKEEIKR